MLIDLKRTIECEAPGAHVTIGTRTEDLAAEGVVLREGRHLHSGRMLLVEGVVQREGEVINLIAQRAGPVTGE